MLDFLPCEIGHTALGVFCSRAGCSLSLVDDIWESVETLKIELIVLKVMPCALELNIGKNSFTKRSRTV